MANSSEVAQWRNSAGDVRQSGEVTAQQDAIMSSRAKGIPSEKQKMWQKKAANKLAVIHPAMMNIVAIVAIQPAGCCRTDEPLFYGKVSPNAALS
jgi:hypothetical protein